MAPTITPALTNSNQPSGLFKGLYVYVTGAVEYSRFAELPSAPTKTRYPEAMANFNLSTATIPDTNELGHLMAKAYQDEPIQRGLMPFELMGDYWGLWLRNDFTRAGENYYKVTDTQTG